MLIFILSSDSLLYVWDDKHKYINIKFRFVKRFYFFKLCLYRPLKTPSSFLHPKPFTKAGSSKGALKH